MFLKNNQHLFKTNGYHLYKNRNKSEKKYCILLESSKPNDIKRLPPKSLKKQFSSYLLHKYFHSLNQFYDTDIKLFKSLFNHK